MIGEVSVTVTHKGDPLAPAAPGWKEKQAAIASLPEPSAAQLAANFTTAMAGWIVAGAPVVDQATYTARAAACEACELWDGGARLGLGKCLAPGCGCTKFKRWLATEQCKHPAGSRWPAL